MASAPASNTDAIRVFQRWFRRGSDKNDLKETPHIVVMEKSHFWKDPRAKRTIFRVIFYADFQHFAFEGADSSEE